MNKQRAMPPKGKKEIDEKGYKRLLNAKKVAEEELKQLRLEIHEAQESECTLSENSSFISLISQERAKTAELNRLNDELQDCYVVESSDDAFVGFGDVITTEIHYPDGDSEIVDFTIVSSSPNLEENEVSHNSPIGNALFKKKIGDMVTFKMNNGDTATLKIIAKK